MHLFWESVIEPLLDAVSPTVIVEVGAAEGHNTRNLVSYAAGSSCTLHVIDPDPLFDTDEAAGTLGESFVLHRERSLNALRGIPDPDVVLLDGDHNWYTVLHELQLLEKGAREAGRMFPTVLLHDIDWPYGRRDLYYEPDAVPPGYRLPYRRAGLLPDSAEPVERGGLNGHLHNAIYTHNVRNGVRTAVEDFLAERDGDLVFHSVPGNHGLGILCPDPKGRKGAAPLRRQLGRLTSAQFFLEQGRRIEELRIEAVIAAKEEKRRRRETDAQLKGKVAEMEDALEQGRRQREAARHELDRAEGRAVASDRQLEERQRELDGMAADLAASAEAARRNADALRAAEERAAAAECGRAELQGELDVRAEALAAAQSVAATGERERDELQTALAQVEAGAAAAQQQLVDLEREREALAAELEASAEGARRNADALRAADERAAAAERVRDELQDTLAQVEARAATAQQQVVDLRAEREVAEAQATALAAEAATSTAALEAAAEEARRNADALRAAEERAAAAGSERAELQAELYAHTEALAAAQSVAATGERERDELQAALVRAEAGAATARQQVVGLQGEHEAMAARTEGLTAAVAATAEALRQAERRVSVAEVVRGQAQADLTRLEQEARAGARARDEAHERVRGLTEALHVESGRAAVGAAAHSELARRYERQRQERELLLEALDSHIERTAASRSLRYGHRFFRMAAVLSFRGPKRQGTALDSAADVMARLKEIDRETGPSQAPVREAAGDAPASHTTPEPATSTAALEPESPSTGEEPGFALEQPLRASFADRYAALRKGSGLHHLSEAELSGPLARDGRGVLAGSSGARHAAVDTDVIVCVKDALEDVRRCLWSVLHYTDRSFRLIVVDDGSDVPTRSMLEELAAREPAIDLLRNEGPDHGYTRAANIGLRASTGDYVVLLNSDTVVTPGWLDRLIACGQSDEAIGVVGPLSNAATHQSIPRVKADGGWAVNDLPHWLTPATTAHLVAGLSKRQRVSFPFVNGFCYAIKRQALDRVGLLDEDLFGSGYCEENDLSMRLHDAGFSLAVAGDSYVFHAKSRSYAPEGRKAVAGRNYERFLRKHGQERVAALLAELERENGLDDVRRTMTEATRSPDATVEAFRAACPRPLEVLFVLHGMSPGSSGGGHSIYQEVSGMRRLGIPARIAIGAKGLEHARVAYRDADELFVPFRDEEQLQSIAAGANVIVATHFTTVALVERLRRARADVLPAYYVQDYEPFFLEPNSPRMVEVAGSYTAVPDLLLFAKTDWLCNMVGSSHGVHVAKVEPSIDEQVYNLAGRQEAEDGCVRVAAMIRPRTPRRQPGATLAVLRELERRRPDRVQVTTFGCEPAQLDAVSAGPSPGEHRGILERAEVADLLRTADVFLDLSTYQAFGRTALEAMACGGTAVIPAIGGVREFAAGAENAILVDTLRPESVTSALVDLVDDPDRLSRLKGNAVATAGRYSILKAALAQYTLFEREHGVRLMGLGSEAAAAKRSRRWKLPTASRPAPDGRCATR